MGSWVMPLMSQNAGSRLVRIRCTSVGRVGLLAVFLGVGAAVVSVPALAFADTTGSSGSSASASPGPAAKGHPARSGVRARPQTDTDAHVDMSDAGPSVALPLVKSSGGRGQNSLPGVRVEGAVEPTTTGKRIVSDVVSAALSSARSFDGGDGLPEIAVAARASVASSAGVGDIFGVFFSDGTAEHPDGGIIVGNGYSWTAESCTPIASRAIFRSAIR